MYKQEELFLKLKEHANLGEIKTKLLESLISDVDAVNEAKFPRDFEIYIDFDTDSNDENNEYQTFQIRIKSRKSDETALVSSGHTIESLDWNLDTLISFLEETDGSMPHTIGWKQSEKMKKGNEKMLKRVQDFLNEKNLVYTTPDDSICCTALSHFENLDIDAQLAKLGRDADSITGKMNETVYPEDQHWINDLALVSLVKYYYNKCTTLESKLNQVEDELLVTKIMK